MNFVNLQAPSITPSIAWTTAIGEEVNDTIQAELETGLDPEIRGLLASIGIEKGEPFNPDERMKILTEAAKVGSVTAQA